MNLPIAISYACSEIGEEITSWFPCIMETWFFGSAELMGLMLYVLFGLMIYRGQLKLSIIVITNLILSLILAVTTASTAFRIMYIISIILSMGVIVFALITRFTREN